MKKRWKKKIKKAQNSAIRGRRNKAVIHSGNLIAKPEELPRLVD